MVRHMLAYSSWFSEWPGLGYETESALAYIL